MHPGGFRSGQGMFEGGDCVRRCGGVMAMIYRAYWKSHECLTRDLSIPAVGKYLSDENTMVPLKVPGLYAFLTLAHKWRSSSAPYDQHLCALYKTPGCTYRLIHVVEGLVCLNKCSVL